MKKILCLILCAVSMCAGSKSAAQQHPSHSLAKLEHPSTVSVINGVSVPSDFPRFTPTILNAGKTAPGRIFIGNWSWSGDRHYMMVLENDGTPYYYQRLPAAHERDFKLQAATGTYTRRVYDDLNCFLEMDSLFEVTDTLRCGNGLGTDEHEVQLLPNHHCLLIGLDSRQVDMSKLVSGGSTNATVIGNTVQELDQNHKVVFEWKSWDHFSITDAVHENLRASSIDYVHMNSIAVDFDSNLIISSRHLSEVTKIERGTGRILWRFGGAHNQFQILNDALGGPSYQHDVRPVPGKPGRYTMMDNGNFHTPSSVSRAVEYEIDTVNWRAIKVWEYRHTPSDYYTSFMGNVQRLANGNTLIDWGDAPLPKATEVTPAGEIVYEADFQKSAYCYRAYRFEYEGVQKAPYLITEPGSDRVTLIFNKFGDKHVQRYIIYCSTLPNASEPIDSTSQTWIDVNRLQSGWNYYFRVTARDSDGTESPYSNEEKVFFRKYTPGSNLVLNGDFSQGQNNWTFGLFDGAVGSVFAKNGENTVAISNAGTQHWSVQLVQPGIPLINGKEYKFEFDVSASNNRTIDALLEQNGGSYTNYSHTSMVAVSKAKTHKSFSFVMSSPTDMEARVTFNMGGGTDTVRLSNVSVKEAVSTGIDRTLPAPASFALEQNFPNPFNPSTTLRYQLPGSGMRYRIALRIYDMLGREVAAPEIGEKMSGVYQTEWDASAFSGGIYLCRLIAQPLSGGSVFQDAKKLVLMK